MSEFNGNEPIPAAVEKLKYWIMTREKIRELKDGGYAKPWTNDHIFQTTYFCNVNRENDRITRFIRSMYSPFVADPMFEVNIGFSRIINHPDTLAEIGYITSEQQFASVGRRLQERQSRGETTFGDAYIVSTNGRTMPKAQYVAEMLLPALYEWFGPPFAWACAGVAPTCAAAYARYKQVFGISSFMAGQNIADLKNTPDHPLYTAVDKRQFCCSGPGSLRGLSWIYRGTDTQPLPKRFSQEICQLADMLGPVYTSWIDMQDLQNCLCEFDKYCRIEAGVGRSKRKYPGV